MFKLISSFLFLSLTLSQIKKAILNSNNLMTIYNKGPSSIKDVYHINYNRPNYTFYLEVVPTTYPNSILINPNSEGVKIYGVSYNKGIIQLATFPNQLANTSYISYTAGVGSLIYSDTDVYYQASGLSWAAYYTLIFNADLNRANFSGYVNVQNRTGKNYTHVELTLSSGSQGLNSYILKNGVFMKQRVQTAPGQQQQVYSSGREYDMSRSQRYEINEGINQIRLLNSTVFNVPIQTILTATVEVGVPRQQIKFTTEYRMQNNNMYYGLGEALPKGTVKIFRKFRGLTKELTTSPTEHVDPGSNMTFKVGGDRWNLRSGYVRNGNKVQLQITNVESFPAPIELRLLSRKNTVILYDTGYEGPRWEMSGGSLKISMTIPRNSWRKIQWNESGNPFGKK